MNFIGAKVYYEKLTGDIILVTDERQGATRATTIDEDFQLYESLKTRVKDSVGVIELEYGQYRQDFAECNGYRVNPTTLELEFNYPDPNNPTPTEPVYQKPLSEKVKELETRQTETENAILALMDMQLM